MISKLEQRLGLEAGEANVKAVSNLWKLCQNEAALLDVVNQTCSLFDSEVRSFITFFFETFVTGLWQPAVQELTI